MFLEMKTFEHKSSSLPTSYDLKHAASNQSLNTPYWIICHRVGCHFTFFRRLQLHYARVLSSFVVAHPVPYIAVPPSTLCTARWLPETGNTAERLSNVWHVGAAVESTHAGKLSEDRFGRLQRQMKPRQRLLRQETDNSGSRQVKRHIVLSIIIEGIHPNYTCLELQDNFLTQKKSHCWFSPSPCVVRLFITLIKVIENVVCVWLL